MKAHDIDHYELTDGYIFLHVYTSDNPEIIDRDKFEAWLDEDDRLNWELNGSDHTGNHVQSIGKMSMDEYWESDRQFIWQDLADYWNTHRVPDVFQDIFDGIKRVTKTR